MGISLLRPTRAGGSCCGAGRGAHPQHLQALHCSGGCPGPTTGEPPGAGGTGSPGHCPKHWPDAAPPSWAAAPGHGPERPRASSCCTVLPPLPIPTTPLHPLLLPQPSSSRPELPSLGLCPLLAPGPSAHLGTPPAQGQPLSCPRSPLFPRMRWPPCTGSAASGCPAAAPTLIP